MKRVVVLALALLITGPARGEVPHSTIITPDVEARLGPVGYRSGHYFATVYDADGAQWQVDSYFGDTDYSIGANCRSDTPICIQRLW